MNILSLGVSRAVVVVEAVTDVVKVVAVALDFVQWFSFHITINRVLFVGYT